MSKNDEQLQRDIEDDLSWDPKINHTQIGVSVGGGAVSLFGAVSAYSDSDGASSRSRPGAGRTRNAGALER